MKIRMFFQSEWKESAYLLRAHAKSLNYKENMYAHKLGKKSSNTVSRDMD